MLDRLLRTDHKAVEKNEPVSKVLGWLREETKQPPIILDGKLPYGIPNKSALMSSRFHDNAAISKYTRPTPRLYEKTSVHDALDAFSESLAPYLPVTKSSNDTLAGYVHALDLAREVAAPLDAAQLAHPTPILQEDERIGRAIKSFHDSRSDYLPAVDGKGKLTGVLPRRNVLGIELNRQQSQGNGDRASDNDPLLRTTVHDQLEDGAITVPPQADYETVIETLDKSGYAIVAEPDGTNIQGVILPEFVVRAVRPHHTTPSAGSTHGAGVSSRR